MAYTSKRKAFRSLRHCWQWLPKRAIVGTVIGGLIVLCFWEWLKWGDDVNEGDQLSEFDRQMQCKQLRVAFHGCLKEFDADYDVSRDSLGQILSVLYRQRTQLIPGEILKFWQPAKIRKDNIIDSFLVAFEANGCDTNGLQYSRHLRK